MSLPDNITDLFALAMREPERLRARLEEGPPTRERQRIELALCGAETMEQSRALMDYICSDPDRWEASIRFWRDIDEPPDGPVN